MLWWAPLALVAAWCCALPLVTRALQEPVTVVPPPTPEPPPPFVEVNGKAALAVQVPTGVAPAEAQQVAQQTQETLKQVATGEVTQAEATRDPADTIDQGDGSTFWLLSMLFGLIVAPLVSYGSERAEKIDSRLGGVITGLGLVAFYLGAWLLLAKGNPSLPQDWQAWLGAAFQGAGVGSIAVSAARSTLGRRQPAEATAGGQP